MVVVWGYSSHLSCLFPQHGEGKKHERQIMLEGCDYLKFDVYQRNPIGGSYDMYPASSASTAKLIQVTWGCSRSVLGTKMNTEIVQSSKIVIRKNEQG